MAAIHTLLISDNKKRGLTLEDIAYRLQINTDHILYIASDTLNDAGSFEEACQKFIVSDQEYAILSATETPYQTWTVQLISKVQRYCIPRTFTFFDKRFVDNLVLK